MRSHRFGALCGLVFFVLTASTPTKVAAQDVDRPRKPEGEPAASEKKVNFVMEKKPWRMVIEYFNDKFDTPIVSKNLPTGTFNFIPPKEKQFTLPEVVDLLNDAMHAQKFTLVRRRYSFDIVSTEESFDYTKLPQITPADLDKRGRTERVAVLVPLKKTLSAEELAGELKELLGPSGEISALPKSNELLIHDSAASVRRICTILKIFEKKPVPAPAPEGKKVRRFAVEMRALPWDATLDLLADQSNMEIVEARGRPTGTFSLFSPSQGEEPREYSVNEFVELMNQILTGNRYLLMRRTYWWDLLCADQRVEPFLVAHIQPQDLGIRKSTELVSLEVELQTLRAATIAPDLRKRMTPFGRVVVLTKENRLVLQDTVASLRRVCGFVNEQEKKKPLDAAPAPADPKFAFDLKDKSWNGMLEWLADKTGLPVVTDQPSPEAFTSPIPGDSGAKEFTASEVIEILNKGLGSQKFVIARRQGSLAVLSTAPKKPAKEEADEELPVDRLSTIFGNTRVWAYLVRGPRSIVRLRATIGIYNVFKTMGLAEDTIEAARVLRVDSRDIFFQVDDAVYALHVGQLVKETLAKPLGPAQLKKLDLTPEPRPRANTEPPTVKLGKVPAVALAERKPVTDEEAKRIKALIANLAKIEGSEFGLPATIDGKSISSASSTPSSGGIPRFNRVLPAIETQRQSFSPIPGHARAGVSPVLKSLVALGPDALPFLLESLDDRTPTKVTIRDDENYGRISLRNDLEINPVNPPERAVLAMRRIPSEDLPGLPVNSYTVKVGDICFVAIGQIVGRDYKAVPYQFSAFVCSPTRDQKLRAEIWAIWESKEPAKRLLDSLLTDYSTQGIDKGESLSGWWNASHIQVEAALRLLYYFPKESASLIAARLRALDVEDAGGDDKRYLARELRNGVRTAEFIAAVAWSKDPAIREALSTIAKRTKDREILKVLDPKTMEGTKP